MIRYRTPCKKKTHTILHVHSHPHTRCWARRHRTLSMMTQLTLQPLCASGRGFVHARGGRGWEEYRWRLSRSSAGTSRERGRERETPQSESDQRRLNGLVERTTLLSGSPLICPSDRQKRPLFCKGLQIEAVRKRVKWRERRFHHFYAPKDSWMPKIWLFGEKQKWDELGLRVTENLHRIIDEDLSDAVNKSSLSTPSDSGRSSLQDCVKREQRGPQGFSLEQSHRAVRGRHK